MDSGSVVASGGVEFVYSGGVASATLLSAGGQVAVLSGGLAIEAVVASGGVLVVSSGGVASATVVRLGGTIDLAALPYTGSGAATLNHITDVLTVTEGSTGTLLQLAGSYTGEGFAVAADGSGGTNVTADTPCYCRGTLILTDQGEVAIEELAIGDILITRAERRRPIRWIGWRAYAGRFIAGNLAVLPVVIRRDALADQVPKRDLMVSPQHALLLDGILIPARALLNGGSIAQLRAVEELEYFHLELDSHDVIMAEGAAAESYLDDQNRFMFQNAAEYDEIYPDQRPEAQEYCATRLATGSLVTAIRDRLARRGEECGYFPPGSITIPLAVGIASVTVPAGVGVLRLVSRSGMVVADLRWLGALVTEVSIDGVTMALDDAKLTSGWNECEIHGGREVRWTTGEAKITLDPEEFERSCEIMVAKVTDADQMPQSLFTIRIDAAGTTRVKVPAGAGELRLVSSCGWGDGDIRRLGVLITRFTLGDDVLDLASPCFVRGFHPAELHGARLVRWTDGEATVLIAPRPSARWCEIEIATVICDDQVPFASFTIEIKAAGTVGVMVPAGVEEVRLVSPSGWIDGDIRRLGALVMGFSVGGEALDLAGAGFAEGFHAEERHDGRTVRWTDGDGVVMIERLAGECWCEIEISGIGGSSGAAAKAA